MILPAADSLKLSDFDFELPESLIAQEPAPVRDQSRLMVLHRKTGQIEHLVFADMASVLLPGDLLVVNNTKVFPCRLHARKAGGGKAELFLLEELGLNRWTALVKGGTAEGRVLMLDRGLSAEVVSVNDDGTREVRFTGVPDIRTELPAIGKTPLPPYIRREAVQGDQERYQTVFALHEGAVAAPTAGLHFTPELLGRLASIGIESTAITLHVGPGTFQPVKADRIIEHRMLPERYEIPEQAAKAINRAVSERRRVIAVGTTSVRTIESAASDDGVVSAGRGSSDLFIYPGYRFRVTSAIITNFHLPKSTLLMLVSAFAGRDRIASAYAAAIASKYRFYSYGDAMLIL
jgi:S-adenosylmethionine:tRNA ribosyltransferase-isomerase